MRGNVEDLSGIKYNTLQCTADCNKLDGLTSLRGYTSNGILRSLWKPEQLKRYIVAASLLATAVLHILGPQDIVTRLFHFW